MLRFGIGIGISVFCARMYRCHAAEALADPNRRLQNISLDFGEFRDFFAVRQTNLDRRHHKTKPNPHHGHLLPNDETGRIFPKGNRGFSLGCWPKCPLQEGWKYGFSKQMKSSYLTNTPPAARVVIFKNLSRAFSQGIIPKRASEQGIASGFPPGGEFFPSGRGADAPLSLAEVFRLALAELPAMNSESAKRRHD